VYTNKPGISITYNSTKTVSVMIAQFSNDRHSCVTSFAFCIFKTYTAKGMLF